MKKEIIATYKMNSGNPYKAHFTDISYHNYWGFSEVVFFGKILESENKYMPKGEFTIVTMTHDKFLPEKYAYTTDVKDFKIIKRIYKKKKNFWDKFKEYVNKRQKKNNGDDVN